MRGLRRAHLLSLSYFPGQRRDERLQLDSMLTEAVTKMHKLILARMDADLAGAFAR